MFKNVQNTFVINVTNIFLELTIIVCVSERLIDERKMRVRTEK